jgi:YD repeat-containing protein
VLKHIYNNLTLSTFTRRLVSVAVLAIVTVCLTQQNFGQHSDAITYTYDKLNRLTGAFYASGAAIIYTYDAAGNRTSIQVSAGNSNPAIISLNPNAVTAGAPSFDLTVNGANFVNNSVVQWNGANRSTTFVNTTQVRATISAVDVAAPTVVNLTVVNPGHVVSNAISFTVSNTTAGTRILTMTSLNPDSGVGFSVSPNDNNGALGGTTTFSRTYNNNTNVTLTAPTTASGNNFVKWQRNGLDWSFNQSTSVTMDANYTMTAVFVPPPTIFTEPITGNAIGLDSVTLVRGPFKLVNPFYFNVDQRTRVIFYTSDLGLLQPNSSILTVQASGQSVPVENVGPVTGVPGLSASYIIVRLPASLPSGPLPLTITLKGVTSNTATLSITP